MLTSLLITLREGLEAALIVGIILAYLAKIGRVDSAKYVWLGTGLAVVASLAAGAAIYVTAGDLSGRAEQVFEGSTMTLAAAVLTWMIFWMRREAANVRTSLQSRIDSRLARGSWLGLAALAFVAVVREGIETVLFLFAASRTAESPIWATIGGLIGLAAAIGIGYVLYRGTARLNLRAFFHVTSVILIVFAAGMLSHAVHEFVEAGIVPGVVQPVWDTGAVLPDGSGAGRFLASLLGYSSDPSLSEVAAWSFYLIGAFTGFFWPHRKVRAARA
jgi:high-affinity iron transporter